MKNRILVIVFIGLFFNSYAQPLVVNASGAYAICDIEDSYINASASGGTGIYTYSWTNNQDASVLTGAYQIVHPLVTTLYTVTVNDGSSTDSDTMSIMVYPLPGIVLSMSPVFGCGSLTSTCSFSTTGPMSDPYWEFDVYWELAATVTPTFTSPGTYYAYLGFISTGGCWRDTMIPSAITVISAPSLSFSVTDESAPGNGAIDMTITPSAAYTIDWAHDPGTGDAEDQVGLTSGWYYATVSFGSCSVLDSVYVADLFSVTIDSINLTEAYCSGVCDGSITIHASSTTNQYSIDGGLTFSASNIFPGLCPGEYYIKITDGISSAADTIELWPSTGVGLLVGGYPQSCGGVCDASVYSSAFAGVPPYTQLWSTGDTSSFVSGLCAGIYTVTITDQEGCTATESLTIPGLPMTTVTYTVDNVMGCGPLTSTFVNLTPGTITCNWDFGDGFTASGSIVSHTFSTSGCYDITLAVTTVTGCAFDTTILNQICVFGAPTVSYSVTPESLTGGDGAIDITVGPGLHFYDWDGDGFDDPQDLINVPGGFYTIKIMNPSGCIKTLTIYIPSSIPVSISTVSPYSASCNGLCNGSIFVAGSAHINQYSVDGGLTFQASNLFSGLCAGTYIIVATDGSTYDTTTAIITEPPLLVTSATGTTTICIGQSATLTGAVSGGAWPFLFYWTPSGGTTGGGGLTYTVNPTVTTVYTFNVMDSCGLTSTTVTVTVNPPLGIFATASTGICLGDSVLLSAVASGGNGGPYTYIWTNNVDLTTLTGSNQMVSPTTATMYTVTANDACSTPVVSTTTNVIIYPQPVLSFTVTHDSGAGNGAIDMTATGAVSYDWNNDGTGDFDDTQDLSGLTTGTYIVSAMSANGCITTDTVFVGVAGIIENSEVTNYFYPNPCGDKLFFKDNVNNYFNFQLVDISGQIVITNVRLEHNSFDMTGVQNGVYF